MGLKCEMVRFKDDYRILVKDESEGRQIIKALQAALKEFDLELSDDKTSIHVLPEGLFRSWASLYHVVHPKKRSYFQWKDFRELYRAVLRIDKQCPGTGVIDRFLADIISNKGDLKLKVSSRNLQKSMSMLLMLGNRRVKAFPKVLAIIESILRSPFGADLKGDILAYVESYLRILAKDGDRNQYLLSWMGYFLVSNGLKDRLTDWPEFADPITRSVFANRGRIFKSSADFKLFEGSRSIGQRMSMLEHLDIFNPPQPT